MHTTSITILTQCHWKRFISYILYIDQRIQETLRLTHEQFDHIRFQSMWLSNLFEKIVFEKAGLHVSPMLENPGRIALTNNNLYFQPLNNIYAEPVITVKLSDLRLVVKRRYLLTHVGLELFTKKGKHFSDMRASLIYTARLIIMCLNMAPSGRLVTPINN